MCIFFNQTNVGLFFMLIIVDYWLSFLRLKVFHALIHESEWWVLVTRKMTKKGHNVREYVLSKEWLQKKRDRSLRVLVDKCLSCTLYEEDFPVNML